MKKLLNILALTMVLTAITPIAASATPYDNELIQTIDNQPILKVTPNGVRINLSDDESRTFYFYSITGQLVKSVTISESSVVDLPQGCYIVKSAGWSKKIVVK